MKQNASLVLIMGVAGSGKTTIGQMLAKELGWPYFEADDFHPATNVAKMSRGEPLSDADRVPWLEGIHTKMRECAQEHKPAIFSCSALKRTYRDILLRGLNQVLVVHLAGDPATIRARVTARLGHFMKAGMVDSQFAALEQPEGALVIDAADQPASIVRRIMAELTRQLH